MKPAQILVIDLGSQYTLVIGRTLRELDFRSAILDPKKAEKWLTNNRPKAIILSGGSASIYDVGSPQPPKKILTMGIPILGICYGMQWLADALGGEVINSRDKKEYGQTEISYIETMGSLFTDMKGITVDGWASHGDSVGILPAGFHILAWSGNKQTIAAMGNEKKKMWGLQFHPEVTHTIGGKKILDNFLRLISGCAHDWVPTDIIYDIRQDITEAVGDKKAIIGFSGGVDSTTLSAIINPTLKDRLQAVCIDTGALRKNEIEEIKINAEEAGVSLKIIDATDRFQEKMLDSIDAEAKRNAFKLLYVKILEEAAEDFGADFIIQGSLATDHIESRGVGEAALIKSHHNIGNNWNLNDLHPIRNLFKYEIRELAREMGLPESISERQPFPGPGLFIRVVGLPATLANLAIVKEADATVTEILKKHNIYKDISQLIVALIGVKTVGIKGDGRSYDYPIVVRAVKTRDFMTVEGYDIPSKIKKEIEKAVTTHPEVNRVWHDSTDKPPATTELE